MNCQGRGSRPVLWRFSFCEYGCESTWTGSAQQPPRNAPSEAPSKTPEEARHGGHRGAAAAERKQSPATRQKAAATEDFRGYGQGSWLSLKSNDFSGAASRPVRGQTTVLVLPRCGLLFLVEIIRLFRGPFRGPVEVAHPVPVRQGRRFCVANVRGLAPGPSRADGGDGGSVYVKGRVIRPIQLSP